MMTRICDRCGRPLADGSLRYVARIEVFAAYDPLKINPEDLRRDQAVEIDQLLEQCETMTEEELMRDVFVQFQFDLCRRCQVRFVDSPLKSVD